MWKIVLLLSVMVIMVSTLINYDSDNPLLLSAKRKLFDVEEKFYENNFLTLEWEDNNEFNIYIDETYFLHSLERYKTTESFILYPLTYCEKIRRADGILEIALIGPETGFMAEPLQRIKSVFSVLDVYTTDIGITEFFRKDEFFAYQNDNSLNKSNLRIFQTDVINDIQFQKRTYDLIYLNFLDPYNSELAKVYSKEFYKKIDKVLKPGGMIVVNGTTPFFTKKSAETIFSNLTDVFKWVKPYYITLNAQGEWSFFIASQKSHKMDPSFVLSRAKANYLNNSVCDTLDVFPDDMILRPIKHAGSINGQFISGWKSLVNARSIQMKL
ncbi:hypothetical protein KAJ27_09410 [bacterium]|nr:hypothetical protein [bacterium]